MLDWRTVTLMVHVTAAAFLFGGSAGITRPVRRSLELGGKALLMAAEDLVRRGKMVGMSSMMTLMTGVVLTATRAEGFGKSPKNFHAALALMLGAIVLSLFVMRPSAASVLSEAKREAPDQGKVLSSLKKIAMGQGILHALWLVLLLLMFLRF